MSRRRFLVLEGPAGVGKTTLLPLVCAELAGMGMQAVAMPEFCSGPLGNYLRDEALQDKTRMQRQLNGLPSLLAFLTSRVALLAEVNEREGDVVVCDRFFPTEILHALHDLAETGEQLAGSAIIAAILRWADHFLAPDSLIVRLVAADNRLRLEQRLGCVLDQQLLDWCLSSERRYETLPDLGLPWEVTRVPNDMPPQTVARDIGRIALERWQRP